MITTHKINIDLQRIHPAYVVPVMQDDKYSRNIEFTVKENGAEWPIPDGTTAVIRFRKPDGTGGNYDALPNGDAAYTMPSIDGNTVTVALAPQVCTVPGIVKLSVCLVNGDAELNTFAINLHVQKNPGLSVHSENYYKIAGSVADSGWEPDMYLGTDEDGRVVARQLDISRTLALRLDAEDFTQGDVSYFTYTEAPAWDWLTSVDNLDFELTCVVNGETIVYKKEDCSIVFSSATSWIFAPSGESDATPWLEIGNKDDNMYASVSLATEDTGAYILESCSLKVYRKRNFVQTVNGNAPDENGNVEVQADTGGSSGGIWTDKTFAAFGTSITWACSNYDGGYLEVVKNRNGFASFLNAGVSGAAMANNTANGNGINYKIRNTDIADYDLVLIECTTNDFKLNVSLGEVGIMGDTNFDTDTFCGALRDSIEYILSADPTKQIMLITDPQRNNAGYDVNYTNSAGHKLLDYVNALHKIAALYGLPVCDWYRNSGFNALTLGTYTTDGLHPNATGYTVLGNMTASCVANMYSTCVYVEGEGGSSGDDTGDTGDSGETEATEAFVDVVTTYSTGYVDSAGAIVTDYATNWRATDYIAVSEGETYKYIGNTSVGTSALSNVWGYDADKNPVQELLAQGDYSAGAEFTIPSGISYIRCGYYYKNANGYRIQKLVENVEIAGADTSKIVANVYINDSNVQTALDGNYLYDEFIDITAVLLMYTPVYDDYGSIRLAEYDESKNFIKRWYGYFMPGELASKVSSNCKYIKFGDNKSGNVVNTLQLATIN